MIEIWKKSELDRLIRAYGFHYSKAYGQNFLTDRNILEKIVSGAEISPDDHVVEVGPGAGALTVLLAQAAGRVTAVEIDERIIPLLRDATAGLPNVEIVNEDFLKFEMTRADNGVTKADNGDGSLCLVSTRQREPSPLSAPCKLVGNLPYYITTPIIAKLFEPGADGIRPAPPSLSVLMVQKEVAERLLSPPGKKAYGAISVLIQYYTEASLLFTVSREAFFPKPGVDSAVIRLRPRDLSGDDPAVAARMFRLVRAGFDMRRKTLRNSLSRAGFSDEAMQAAYAAAGIDPGLRAETLSAREFYTLASYL